MSDSLIESRIASHENTNVSSSRLLILIRSEDLALRCFRVLRTMKVGHCAQHQNLSYGKHAPHPARQASPGNVKSQCVDVTCLIGISHRKDMVDVSMLERRLI